MPTSIITLKSIWQFLKNLNMYILSNSFIPLLGIFLREMKAHTHTKTYTWMFTTAYLAVAPNRKQPKSLSTVDNNGDIFI